MLHENDIRLSLDCWRDWRPVFEHGPAVASSPLLLYRGQFDRFLKNYSVRRTIRKGASEALREQLREPAWCRAVEDVSGADIDAQEQVLRSTFGTRDGQRGLISALSKVASLLVPDAFNAWDRFARAGVNRAFGRPRSPAFGSYAAYLHDVNQLLAGELGDAVRALCAGRYPTAMAAVGEPFHRRVLDVHLMRLGGRWD